MTRCQHGVYCPSSDWALQADAGIPERDRVAYHCGLCRPQEQVEYREELILRLARENVMEAARSVLSEAA